MMASDPTISDADLESILADVEAEREAKERYVALMTTERPDPLAVAEAESIWHQVAGRLPSALIGPLARECLRARAESASRASPPGEA
jgi:hypothetical protein